MFVCFQKIPFEGESSYQREFVPRQGERYSGEDRALPPAPKLPFEGDTTYKAEYIPKRGERAEQAAEQPVVPRIPFQGQTSYTADYVAQPTMDRSELYPEAVEPPPV